jgi:hypothetical protein
MKVLQNVELVLLLSALAVGCPALFMKDVNGDGRYRICTIGDSISTLDPSRNWYGSPYLLVEMVEAAHPAWEVLNESNAGATVAPYPQWWDFPEEIGETIRDGYDCDVFVLMGGTNDSALGFAPDVVMGTIFDLIDLVSSQPGSPTTLVGLVPNVVPPMATNHPERNILVDEYNNRIKTNIPPDRVVDLWSVTLDPEDHTPEGTHLSLQGECKRARKLFQTFWLNEPVPDTACCQWTEEGDYIPLPEENNCSLLAS